VGRTAVYSKEIAQAWENEGEKSGREPRKVLRGIQNRWIYISFKELDGSLFPGFSAYRGKNIFILHYSAVGHTIQASLWNVYFH
jgi:hypothetical protein